IGLSITSELVSLHHGEIKVQSVLGEGSTFSFTIPLAKQGVENVAIEEEIIVEQADVPIPNSSFSRHYPIEGKRSILIADDEAVNLQVLYNQLSLEDYEVFTVQRGEDVFPMLEKHSIDLLILDIMMPGMSGYDVSKKLRQTYNIVDLPILMLTAKNQLQDKLLAFHAGANDYLVKPCEKEELLTRVQTLVQIKKQNESIQLMNEKLEDKVSERTHELKDAYEELQEMSVSRQQ